LMRASWFLLLFLASLASGQTENASTACSANQRQEPDWRTFTDRTHRFCFQYPPLYRPQKPLRGRYLGPRSKLLLFVANGESPGFTKDGWLQASISVIFSLEAFDLERIVTRAPNGVIKLDPIQVGPYIFHYWGPGGGGVNYPDVYFFNLRGETLQFEFAGPYTGTSKSPDQQTQQIERKVLATFRIF
jgi:hypothetical protein